MITILYEDSRTSEGDFAFHRLVLRLIVDEHGERWTAADLHARVKANPRKGNAKVLAEAASKAGLAENLVAVLDSDRAHELVALTPGDPGLERALRDKGGGCEVVLLVKSLESVIEALRDGSQLSRVPPETFVRALQKRRPEREDVLRAASHEAERAARDDLRTRVPSLVVLAQTIVRALELEDDSSR